MECTCDNCCDTSTLYTLPCRHRVCANCIIPCNKMTVECSRCRARCQKENVIEYIEESVDSDDYNEFYEFN